MAAKKGAWEVTPPKLDLSIFRLSELGVLYSHLSTAHKALLVEKAYADAFFGPSAHVAKEGHLLDCESIGSAGIFPSGSCAGGTTQRFSTWFRTSRGIGLGTKSSMPASKHF